MSDHRDALLHEDVITPVHTHGPREGYLVAKGKDGRLHRVTPAEAGRIAETLKPPEIDEVDQAADGPRRFSRRKVLAGTGIGLGTLLAGSSIPRMAFAAQPAGVTATPRDLLVCVFMRGGFDGLSAIAPVGDSHYYAARPKTAVSAANSIAMPHWRSGFRMNKNLAALEPFASQVAVVMGSGNPKVSRSHFDDQALCEYADSSKATTVENGAPANVRSGWLGRHLASSSTTQGTFRAITFGSSTTLSLTTNFSTLAMSSVASFDLNVWSGVKPQVERAFRTMYSDVGGMAQAQGLATLNAIDRLGPARDTAYKPANGAVYPANSGFASNLQDVANIAKHNLGLEVACVDLGNWDMHQQAGSAANPGDWFSRQAKDFATSLAAFCKDMGSLWNRTTVVTMSEFGRRVLENGDQGYDHGHGNVMFIAGGAVHGGLYGSMPSLAAGNLVEGDVPITTDYRQALSEIVSKRLHNSRLSTVFPGFTPGRSLGVV